MNFAYLDDQNTLYLTSLIDQANTNLTVQAMDGVRYIFTEQDDNKFVEAVTAERIGNDLYLNFTSSQAPSSIVVKDFYQFNAGIYGLTQAGEYRMHLSSESASAQGAVSFATVEMGMHQNQAEGDALKVVHQAATFQRLEALGESLNPTADAPVEPATPAPMMAMAMPEPMAGPVVTEPKIGGFYDHVGAKQGAFTTNGSVTDDKMPLLTGTGQPGSTLDLLQNGEKIASVKVDAQGNWSFLTDVPYAEGGQLFFVRDTATGATSTNFVFFIDTVAPNRAVISNATDDHSGATKVIASGSYTNDNTPTLSGKAEENSMVAIYNGKQLIGTTYADQLGNWSFTPVFLIPDGLYSFSAVAIDFSGNTGLASAKYTFTIDTVAPNQPEIIEVIDNFGAVTGPVRKGGGTDDTTPTFNGHAEAGSRVTIYANGQKLGEVQADASGSWSFTPDNPLDTGAYVFTATATDKTGNTSQASEPWGLKIVLDAPAVPVVESVYDDHGSIVHELNSGDVTDDATPTIKGSAEANTTVVIYDKGVEIGRVPVDENGHWSFTPATPLTDGDHELTFAAVNDAGNSSDASAPWIVVVDTQAPDAPTIGSVYDDVGVITGEVAFGKTTDDTTPTLSGKAEAGSTVVIYDNGQKIGEARADANGDWTFTPATPLAEGDHSFTVQAIDVAGNASELSQAWDIVIDITAPVDPVNDGQGPGISAIIDDHGTVQGPIEKGGVTDDTTPTFKGTGEPGDTIIILDKGEKIGEVAVDEDGNWEFTPKTELEDGSHEITVVIQDPAGNQSKSSAPWEFNVDTQAPDAPTIGSVYDDVGVITGEVAFGKTTDDTTPTLSGKAEAGSTVVIYDNDQKIGEARADTNGDWTFTPATELTEGEHSFTVQATDAAGNTSDLSQPWDIMIDITAPVDPVNDGQGPGLSEIIDDHGASQGPIEKGSVTDDTTPTLKGTGTPGDTVIILDKGEKIGEAPVDKDGNWEFTPKTELEDGSHEITVVIQDPAGNQSKPSAPWEFEVDTQAPNSPTIGSVYDDVGEKVGELERGDITDDQQPTLNGQAEAGSIVVIYDNGQKLGETRADGNGNWSFTPDTPLTEGKHDFTVSATDAAGNTSAMSEPWEVIIATQLPEQPVIELVNDDVGDLTGALHSGDVTDDARPEISGTSDANATVVIYDRGIEIGRVQADDQGKWTFTPETALADGEYSFTAVAVNAAGNSSPASEPFDLIVYTGNGPTQVARVGYMGKDSGQDGHDYITDNGSFGRLMQGELSGKLLAGQSLQISTDGGQSWFNAIVDGTNWAAQDVNGHASSWSIQTRVVDEAGNAGYVMAQNVVLDTIAPRTPTSILLNGNQLQIGFNTADVIVGDRIAIIADGGAHRFEHTLTQEDIAAGVVKLDVGSISSASAAMVDHAGNLSNFANTDTGPSVNSILIGDVSEVYGQSRDNIFSINDVSVLDQIKVIEGNGGVDTLKLNGANQVLDLSAWQGRLSSVEVIDITGKGDNTLKVSLGDVLDTGHLGAFINDDSVQLAVKGNAGDVVQLSDLLPNGMDIGDWENLGVVIAAGITYEVYHHTGMEAEVLVQQGVTVQLV